MLNVLASESMRQLEAEAGVLVYAQAVKVLVLLGQAPARKVSRRWEQWQALFECDLSAVKALFSHAERLGVFELAANHESAALSCCRLQPRPQGCQVFTQAGQWAAWFKAEVNYPQCAVVTPDNVRLFNRWCAVNVSVDEMVQAVEATLQAVQPVKTRYVNEHLRALRKRKLQEVAC